MISSLEEASKMIQYNTKYLLFENPTESLDAFIELIHVVMTKSNKFELQLSRVQKQNIQFKGNIDVKEYELEQKIQLIRSLMQTEEKQSKTIQILSQDIEQLQKKRTQEQKSLFIQIGKLKVDLDSLDRKLSIKYMIQKKIVTDQANKQLIQYRQNVQRQFTKQQKSLRYEIDKKDKELRGILYTMNNFLQQNANQKQVQNPVQKPEGKSKMSQYLSTQQLNALQNVIKPFTEYNSLNEKISEIRKQLSKAKQENRSLFTKNATIQNQFILLKNQKQIMLSQLQIKDQQFFQLNTLHQTISSQNQKMKTDIKAMQDYYEHRWNNQFNSVRTNLQKKYNGKIKEYEDQYTQKIQNLDKQKIRIAIDINKMALQIQVIMKKNNQLEQQLKKTQEYKKRFQQILQSLQNQKKQGELMHRQQIISYKYQMQFHFNRYQTITKQKLNQIQKLQNKLSLTIKNHELQNQKTNKQHLNNVISIKNEMKTYYEQIVQEKDKVITNFSREIQNHKEAITQIQREGSIQVKKTQEKVQKKHQLEIRDLKIQFYGETSKLNDKISQFSNQIFQLRSVVQQQKDKQVKQSIRYERIIKQRQTTINSMNKATKVLQEEKEEDRKILGEKQQIIRELIYDKQSLIVLVKSRQMQIKHLGHQIKQLIMSQKSWKHDLTEVKKDFESKFKQLKQLCDRRISYYKSRIWQLQKLFDSGIISVKDLEKIRSLTEDKRKLEDKVLMKEAENLILGQVKKYYQNKSRESDSKMTVQYELKQFKETKQRIFVKRPHKNNRKSRIIGMKTQVDGEANSSEFDRSQWNSISKINKSFQAGKQQQTNSCIDGFKYKSTQHKTKFVQSAILNIKDNIRNQSPSNRIIPTVITDHERPMKTERNHQKQRIASSML